MSRFESIFLNLIIVSFLPETSIASASELSFIMFKLERFCTLLINSWTPAFDIFPSKYRRSNTTSIPVTSVSSTLSGVILFSVTLKVSREIWATSPPKPFIISTNKEWIFSLPDNSFCSETFSVASKSRI